MKKMMNYEEAKWRVIRFIEEHWGDKLELEIITGNSKERQEMVINILREYNLDYQIGRIYDLNNKGYIVTWTE
jgi:hypothetical protein